MSGPKPDVLPLHHRAAFAVAKVLPKSPLVKNRVLAKLLLQVDFYFFVACVAIFAKNKKVTA